MAMIFYIVRGKYLLNDHEFATNLCAIFIIISQLLIRWISYAGMSIFWQILIKIVLNEM
jgi:hypothetical protein